ncbi:hypothetical protein H6P81_014898 [Aristolochia fimbriata]|uniref:Acyl carrier protein n=1 Tax=Aristolochia fimbriata TaxID=158543 RepID=A0AAV7E3Z4_ARIFI|nr:hypothetical protein H6P81_014898 [Aristolochia fimbriata]
MYQSPNGSKITSRGMQQREGNHSFRLFDSFLTRSFCWKCVGQFCDRKDSYRPLNAVDVAEIDWVWEMVFGLPPGGVSTNEYAMKRLIVDHNNLEHTSMNPAEFNMQFIWTSVLRHVRVRNTLLPRSFVEDCRPIPRPSSCMYASMSTNSDHLMAQVIRLVKKYDRLDASKVTETSDFQKDLCLDSLDRVELVMALEQEFSVEIPEDKADKLTCCADVVNYILTETNYQNAESS